MIRTVADTNVYVSAIVSGGTCEEVLVLARAGLIDLFVSPHILKELRAVLGGTFDRPPVRVREALAEVTALATLVRQARTIHGFTVHGPRHRILECAVAVAAKALQGIRIVSPHAFLDVLAHP